MKKRLSKKTLISVCTLIAALIIWTMWSNTALMLSTVVIRQIKRCRFHQIKTGLSEHLTMG
ncbi:hypothetical protein [Blautia luti]|uniref:hypothetical protein n=1 Tax=Blautia TaxID=572511 RepID=UPI00118213E1|nr:hypothetical protein [Blautia luti]